MAAPAAASGKDIIFQDALADAIHQLDKRGVRVLRLGTPEIAHEWQQLLALDAGLHRGTNLSYETLLEHFRTVVPTGKRRFTTRTLVTRQRDLFRRVFPEPGKPRHRTHWALRYMGLGTEDAQVRLRAELEARRELRRALSSDPTTAVLPRKETPEVEASLRLWQAATLVEDSRQTVVLLLPSSTNGNDPLAETYLFLLEPSSAESHPLFRYTLPAGAAAAAGGGGGGSGGGDRRLRLTRLPTAIEPAPGPDSGRLEMGAEALLVLLQQLLALLLVAAQRGSLHLLHLDTKFSLHYDSTLARLSLRRYFGTLYRAGGNADPKAEGVLEVFDGDAGLNMLLGPPRETLLWMRDSTLQPQTWQEGIEPSLWSVGVIGMQVGRGGADDLDDGRLPTGGRRRQPVGKRHPSEVEELAERVLGGSEWLAVPAGGVVAPHERRLVALVNTLLSARPSDRLAALETLVPTPTPTATAPVTVPEVTETVTVGTTSPADDATMGVGAPFFKG